MRERSENAKGRGDGMGRRGGGGGRGGGGAFSARLIGCSVCSGAPMTTDGADNCAIEGQSCVTVIPLNLIHLFCS